MCNVEYVTRVLQVLVTRRLLCYYTTLLGTLILYMSTTVLLLIRIL